MATRFYLPSSGTAPVTPASFSGSWTFTSGAFVRPTLTTKASTAMTVDSETINSYSGGTQYECIGQFVSAPIASQLFAGTVNGQIFCSESNADFDAMLAITIRVMSNDGSTETGVLLSNFPILLASEYPAGTAGSSEVNRNFPPSTAVVGITASANDRLVFEIGYTSFKTGSTLRSGRHYFGDDQSSDAPVDQTDTNRTTLNPWIEFSQDITFAGTNYIGKLTLMGCGR